MDGIRYASFPEPGQQATIRILATAGDEIAEEAVLLAGRAGGQAILQGVTVEDGFVVNDLGDDHDSRFEGLNETHLLFLDASTDRVGIRVAAPLDVLHLDPGATAGGIRIANASLGTLAAYLQNAIGPHLVSHADHQGVSTAGFAAVRLVFSGLGYQVQTSPATAAGNPRTFTSRLVTEINGNIGIGGTSYGAGVGVVFLANRITLPTSDPTGGALLVPDGGILKVRNAGAGAERRVSLGAQHARLAATQNSSTTTLADLTGLTFNVEAGRTYEYVATLYTDRSASEGVLVQVAGTATATAIIHEQVVWGHGFVPASTPTRATSLPTGGGFSSAAATDSGRFDIRGTITVNAAGTLKLQFARFGAAGTVTAQRGSTFTIQEIA